MSQTYSNYECETYRDKNSVLRVSGNITVEGIKMTFSGSAPASDLRYELRIRLSIVDPSTGSMMQIDQAAKNELLSKCDPKRREKLDDGKCHPEFYVCKNIYLKSTDEEDIHKAVSKAAAKLYDENHVALTAALGMMPVEDIDLLSAFSKYKIPYLASLNCSEKTKAEKARRIMKAAAVYTGKALSELSSGVVLKLKSKLGKSARADLLAAAAFLDYCIEMKALSGENQIRVCLENNNFGKHKDPARLICDKARIKQLDREQEEALNTLLRAKVDDGRSMGLALANGGGFPVSRALSFCWKDVIFDAVDPEKVTIKVLDIVNAGATHNYTHTLFCPEALIVRARRDYLLQSHTADEIASWPVVSGPGSGSDKIASGKESSYIKTQLTKLGISGKALKTLRDDNRKPSASVQLLISNYNSRLFECGIGDAERGLKAFLNCRTIPDVTSDNYRSFTSQEGINNIYAYMRRLSKFRTAANETLPDVESAGGQTISHYAGAPGYVTDIVVKVTLKAGKHLEIDSTHGIVGNIISRNIYKGTSEKLNHPKDLTI